MAEVIKIDPTTFEFQTYESQDLSLINQFNVDTALTSSSYIEFFIYNSNKVLLYKNFNYNQYTVNEDNKVASSNSINQFNVYPENDVTNEGFTTGEYIAYYNFLTKHIGDSNTNLFISGISSDRTEIRLDSNILSNLDIIEQTNNFIQFREDSNYFVDFYLNFGNNDLIIANNVKLENPETDNPTVLVKLYEPLPSQFDLKNQLWIVTTLNESTAFQVTYPITTTSFIDSTPLQGPNYNIILKDEINNSSQNLSYNDIINSTLTSSINQVNSLLEESSINISVDYTNFDDFIHFSSAQTRVENFYYKVGLIQTYTSESNTLVNTSGSNTSITILENKISKIIENFDKFEYFMYYSSGSEISYPKSNSQEPYILYPTTSSQVLTWLGSTNENNSNFGGQLLSASYFDNANPDQLKKAIPEYLREDPANQQYDLFVDMVAQYYDNVWLYTKDVTQKYNADNRLDFGVSKDLVAEAIRDFGVKLYQNNFSNKDLYTAFLGLTPEGSVFPFPEITGSMPVPTGYEFIDTLISASNDNIPLDDVNKSLYKRIYHNIPYLLKSKGTISGLRALITSYGIPDTILKISEFGGKDKVNENDWDYYFNKFNFSWNTQGTNSIEIPWEVNKGLRNHPYDAPGTVELRFKTTGLPNSRVSQSLWFTTSSIGIDKALVLEYTGSYLNSGSYSGSIADPYYQYGNLKYISNPGTVNEVSCSVYLPFFNGDWWSVMVRNNGFDTFDPDYIITEPVDYDFITGEDGSYIVKESSTTESLLRLGNINLFAANKIYNGNDGTQIGFKASSSITDSNASGSWISGSDSYFAKDFTAGSTYQNFSGSMQEIRYYNIALGTTKFYDYTMNPLSIEGNGINASPNELSFRAALGSELDITTTSSIHPKITGSWTSIASFSGSNSSFTFNSTPFYSPNNEYFFLDQFPAGIKNRITDKIRYENSTLPAGDVLSPIRSLSQTVEASASYTDNINYLEVAFSPQNQINDDITSQIGYFNIGDYIGDPRQRFEGNNYPELNELSEDYFKKYIKQYDLTDFVRLIKFFDNSLFKMIKDFIPARTSLASGLVIKQHLLERNKYPQPQVSFENKIHTGSIDMVEISGGAGGVFNEFNSLEFSPLGALGLGPNNRFGITQSWSETYSTLSGSVTKLYDNQDEFYNGELSGSLIIVTNGELNEANSFKLETSNYDLDYELRMYWNNDIRYQRSDSNPSFQYRISPQDLFFSDKNNPKRGYIQFWGGGSTNAAITSYPGLMIPQYVKISRFDKNGKDSSIPLSQLNKLIVTGTNLPGFSPSTLSNTLTLQPILAFDYSNYFIYEVVSFTRNGWQDSNPSGGSGIPFASQVYLKEGYNFTGSISTSSINLNNSDLQPAFINQSQNPFFQNFNKVSILPPLKDSAEGYNSSTQTYTLSTVNQIPLKFIISGSIVANGTTGGGTNASSSLFLYWDKSLYWTSFNPGFVFGNSMVFPGYSQYFNVSAPLANSSVNFAPNATSSIYLELELGPYGDISPTESILYNPPLAGAQIFPVIKKGPREIQGYGSTSITEVHFTPDTKFFISSSEGQINSPYAFALPLNPSQSYVDTFIVPYFETKFTNSDYDVLLGEAQNSRTNKFLQDLDYQTSQNVPVNYNVVVSGSASKATVPRSYYTSLAQINNRYLGSKNQSSNFNIFNPLAGTSSFGDPINIGTYGQLPSVENDQVMIYEYEWAGGTTPEILGWGAYKMDKILQVNSPDSIRTINPGIGLKNQTIKTILPSGILNPIPYNRNATLNQNVSDFYYSLNGNNPTNTNISFFSYGQSNIGSSSPINGKVLTTDFGVPTRSNFILTSSLGEPYGFISSGSNTIQLDSQISMSRVRILNGGYAPGDIFSPISLFSSTSESINTQLNDGERWFITLYNSLDTGSGGTIDNNSLTPYNVGFSGSNSNGDYINPLQFKGVYEIFGIRYFPLSNQVSVTTYSTFTEDKAIGDDGLGALIWRARAAGKNEFVITQNEVGDNGPGCFINEFTPEYVTQNLEQITKEFGSNKQ